ncbi:unnamed protein product [Strongylus vulgaris]|uniref:Protein kinase domain-containing protein n=1 Tax=Strongylus vulgaris TaxID=40348 RepID=A0A3P7JV95_STRVU|nr:unnamed protein product [Strongylus vulgaris]
MSVEEARNLRVGKIVGGRWRLISKLGEGAMGAVYKVEDRNRKNFLGAMKVEDDLTEGGVLKLEVFVLKKLQALKYAIRLYDSGKTMKYCFMVMSLCGEDLMTLKRSYTSGMTRSFVAVDEATGRLAIRQPRGGEQLFRGTPRYCSLTCHLRKEQVCCTQCTNRNILIILRDEWMIYGHGFTLLLRSTLDYLGLSVVRMKMR